MLARNAITVTTDSKASAIVNIVDRYSVTRPSISEVDSSYSHTVSRSYKAITSVVSLCTTVKNLNDDYTWVKTLACIVWPFIINSSIK